MSINEKDTGVAAGLTITRPQNVKRNDLLPTIEDHESLHSITPTLTPTITRHDDRETSPLSPFYTHPTTRTSLDAKKSESKTYIRKYDSDLEACLTDVNSKPNVMSPTLTRHTTGKNCTVWPGQQALKDARRQDKMRRGGSWNPMRNLDPKTKLWVKIVIALFVVGAAVGVGLGITKSVGGGVFKTNNTSSPVA